MRTWAATEIQFVSAFLSLGELPSGLYAAPQLDANGCTMVSIAGWAAGGYTISRVHGVLTAGTGAVLIAGTVGKKTAVFAIKVELAATATYTVTEESGGTLDSGAQSVVLDSSGVPGVPVLLASAADKDISINAITAGLTYTAVVGIEV